jgi:hypothetical protein
MPFSVNSETVEAYLGHGSGHILMIVCGGSGQSYSTSSGYYLSISNVNIALIFSGAGLYDFVKTTVCTLTPKITNVWVDYSNGNSSDDSYDDFFLNSTMINTQTLSGSPDLDGPAGLSAVATIYNMMQFSQGEHTNIVGDQLRSLILNGNLGDDAILPVMVGPI